MTNILLSGYFGAMGQTILNLIMADENSNIKIVCGYDIRPNDGHQDPLFPVYTDLLNVRETANVIIDFSHPSALENVLNFAIKTKTPAVICTTGLSPEQVKLIEKAASDIPVFYSANMSIGVSLIIDLCCKATKVLQDGFDIEIVEKHHNQKVDAPSGTALAIADAISKELEFAPIYTFDRHSVRKKREKAEIGIHAIRGGTIVGEHSIIFAGRDEVIEIKHSAASKEVFAVGAVRAAEFLKDKSAGFYNMKDLI